MLVNLYQKFVDTNGKVVKDINIVEDDVGVQTRETKDLTLEKVVTLALVEPVDQKMSGDNKVKCFELFLCIVAHKAGIVELETDDVSFIKTLIKPKFPVLIVGEAMRMLEGRYIGIATIDDKKEPEDEESKKRNLEYVQEHFDIIDSEDSKEPTPSPTIDIDEADVSKE